MSEGTKAAPAPSSFPRIASGTLLLYRLFDVAGDIDLDRAEEILAGAGERLRLRGERTGFLDLPERPLTADLGPRTLTLEDGAVLEARAFVRFFGIGVASIRYEVNLPRGTGPAELARLVRAAADSGVLAGRARAEVDGLAARIAPSLDEPVTSPLFETYAIVLVGALEGGRVAADCAGVDLARVLLGEPPAAGLSERTVEDATRHRFSYSGEDLCVLDWDTAFVVEPHGDRSVADVLELAAAQLLELRWYDDLFEKEMVAVAGLLGRPRASLAWLSVGRYGRVTRRIQHRVVDSVEFVSRVENAVRIVGDLYLARVYRAAMERFRIESWVSEVLRRQEVAARVAGLLHSEAHSALGHVLEITIILLIVFEIVMALA
jgi:hypothetical protein